MAGFYRPYVCDYAKIAVPMTNQLKTKNHTFNWGEEQQRSFDKIKVALAFGPILAIANPTQPFVLDTDASDKAVGAVLLQMGKPIAFESKKLDKAQQNYSVYEKELYAIVHALKKWRHYLYGAQFEIVFDHESIKWFPQQTDLKGRKARWAEILQEYDARLRYCKGRYNVVADALSRMPEINSLAFTKITSDFLDSLKGLCEHDKAYSKVWSHVKMRDPSHSNAASVPGSSTPSSPPLSDELKRWKNFSIQSGYLLHKGRMCVPTDKDIWRQILYECHDSPSAGHPGIRKTYALVRRQFYWPGLHNDVHNYVTHCSQCQVNKAERLKVGGLLHPLEIPNGKWESISMDFIVGLPTTARGHDSVWVVVDHLTKLYKFIPTKSTIKTPKLARLFVDQLYRLYGLPSNIVSDRDRKFNSHFWRAIFQRLGTHLNLSTADHPQTDGQTERVNQVLEDMLRAYVRKKQTNWEDYLPLLEFAYNSAKHVSTNFSPFMLMYGFQPRSPVTVGLATEKLQHVKDFLQDHMDMLKLARQNVRQAQDWYKKYTDVHRRQVVFKEDDYVFLRVPKHSQSSKIGPTPKLSPRFCGPFKILKRVGSLAYKLELPDTSQVHPVFHVSHLRKHLLQDDNIIDQNVLVDFIEPPNLPHEPEQIMDSHDLRTRHHVRHQLLVKWKDRPEEGATWENESTLKKCFPTFVFEDKNILPRGGVM